MKRQKKLIGLWLFAAVLAMLLAACSPTATTTSPSNSGLGSLAGIGTISAPTATGAPATTAPAAVTTVAAPTTAPATTAVPTVTTAPTATQPPAPTATQVPATTAPAPTATQPPAPTAKPTTPQTDAGIINNVVYKTDKGLYAYNIATAKSFELANGNVIKFAVSPDNKQVAFYIVNGNKITLNLVIFHGNSASQPGELDSNVGTFIAPTEDNPFVGRYLRAYTLAFSPDSKLIAYSRANTNGPTFDMWGAQTKPTEVWLADTNEQNRNVRRLAPNDNKDFMYDVQFSTDAGRVGFLRTTNFPSDVSGSVALWSVHTDGTKLTVLQDGAELSKQVGTAGDGSYPPIGRIGEFYWTNPLGVTFTVSGLDGYSTWVHDLNSGKARQLFGGAFGQNSFTYYDPISRRYAFATDKGIFTIGTANANEKPVQVTAKAKRLLNFRNNSVLFVNDANTVIVQSVNDNGSLAGVALGLPALHKPNGEIENAFPTNGGWLVVWGPNGDFRNATFSVFSGDGKSVTLTPVTVANGNIERLSDDLFLVDSNIAGLSLVDLSGSKPNFTAIYVNQP